MPTQRAGVTDALVAFAVFAAIACASGWPVVAHLATVLPSDLGDPAFTTWTMWWNAKATILTEGWWNAPIFAPATSAFALSESLLAFAPVSTPLIKLGVSPIAVYNLLFLLSAPCTALAAWLLARHLTGSRAAAYVAAFAFGFSPYRIAQMPHLQMLWGCWMPLALLALHHVNESAEIRSPVAAADGDSRRWLALLAVCWLMNGLTNGYFLIYFPVLLAAWMIWFVRDRTTLVAILTTIVATSLLMLPLLIGYRSRQHALGLGRGIDEIQSFSADLTAIWAASPRAWLSQHWTMAPRAEGELYPGIVLLAIVLTGAMYLWKIWTKKQTVLRAEHAHNGALVSRRSRVQPLLFGLAIAAAFLALVCQMTGGWDIAWGPIKWTAHHPSRFVTAAFWACTALVLSSRTVALAWRRRSPLAFYLLGAALMFLMALGPTAEAFGLKMIYKAPYSWLMQFPGGDSLRVPGRFGLLMILCLSVAAAIVWQRVESMFASSSASRLSSRGRAVFFSACAGILLEGVIITPVVAVPARYEVPVAARNAAILELPMGDSYQANTAALLQATRHGHAAVNGFSGYEAPHFAALRRGLLAGDASVLAPLREHFPIAVAVSTGASDAEASLAMVRGVADAEHLGVSDGRDWFLLPQVQPARPDPVWNSTPIAIASIKSAIDPATLRAAIDHDIGSRWGTRRPMQSGDELKITLEREATIAGIEIDLGTFSGDIPSSLEVIADTAAGPVTIWSGSPLALTVRGALDAPRTVPVRLKITTPVSARALTLASKSSDQKLSWSIAELKIFAQ